MSMTHADALANWLGRDDLDGEMCEKTIFPMGNQIGRAAVLNCTVKGSDAKIIVFCGALVAACMFYGMRDDAEFYLKLMQVMTRGFESAA